MRAETQTYSELKTLLRSRSTKAKRLVAELAVHEIERRRAENPLKYFVPNGWAEEYFRSVGHETHKWIYVLPAANSVTKSASTINILGNLIWGVQNPKWFHGPRFEKPWPYPKKFWYISEQSTLRDFICGTDKVTENEIRKWFIPGRFTFEKAGYEYHSRFTSDTGWSGSFKTYDMDTTKFESDKIGVAVFDEPPPKAIYNAVLARMTLGGLILMPMTPLTYSAWVKDDLIDNALPSGPIKVLPGDIEENCVEHGKRGRIPHARIEELVAQYDPEEKEARAHGAFAHLSGLVYKNIHPEVNRHEKPVKAFRQKITPTEEQEGKISPYKVICVCDPHDSKPPIIGWFAVDKWGQMFQVEEFPNGLHDPEFKPFYDYKPGQWRLTIEQTCEWIKRIEAKSGWDPKSITRVMDPNFGRKPDQVVGRTIAEHYRDCGRKINYPLHFSTDVLDDLSTGHQEVRDFFAISPDNETRLRIGKNCTNTWYSLTHYSRRTQSASSLDQHGATENVQVKYKDGADLVRYAIMAYRRPPKSAKARREIRTQDDLVEVHLEKCRKKALAMARRRPYKDSCQI